MENGRREGSEVRWEVGKKGRTEGRTRRAAREGGRRGRERERWREERVCKEEWEGKS